MSGPNKTCSPDLNHDLLLRRKIIFVRSHVKGPLASRREQNLAGGHVRGVLLQSAGSLLQMKLCLEFGFEIASQQFLDLAGET